MTHPLSPAAQAVRLAAICAGPELEGRIAAALRAVAEHMPFESTASLEQMPEHARRWFHLGHRAASSRDCRWLRAIAAELEGGHA